MDKVERLVQINGSNFHIFESKNTLGNDFILELKQKLPSSTYLAVIDGKAVSNLDELFKAFSDAFQFPDYFGNNWAALDECINDLDWLEASSYILVLKDVEKMLSNEQYFSILMKTLYQTANEWRNGRMYDSFPTPPTPFHIIFDVGVDKGNEFKNRLKAEGVQDIDILSI